MFEAELEMEKKQSSFGPLLLVVVLVCSVVGGIGYFVYQQQKGLPQEQAAATINNILAERGPATVAFHVGDIVGSVDDRPTDAHYRLLEKIGIITIGKPKGRVTPIALTAAGEKQLAEIPEFTKVKEPDGSFLITVPLAKRKLVTLESVKMLNPSSARVDYQWKWEPNALGESFDAQGKLVKGFATWDRAMLIEKHGADFYSAAPSKMAVILVKGSNGWKLAQE
jgi:hypothetical protein